MKRFFQLYDVANDYSLSPVEGKYQFGDLKHAKERAQKIIDKWVKGMKRRAGKLSAYKIKWHRTSTSGTRPESKMEWNGSIHDGELVYKIIERSENPVAKKRKKKRSAKQLANDRRLGRMAKARAKNKRKKAPTRRHKKTKVSKTRLKVRQANVHATRRKKRTSLKKSHLWRVFRCRGKSVFWILMDSKGKWNWTKDAGKAILFATKTGAGNVARGISRKSGYAAYQLGAAPREMSAATIAAQCKAGKA